MVFTPVHCDGEAARPRKSLSGAHEPTSAIMELGASNAKASGSSQSESQCLVPLRVRPPLNSVNRYHKVMQGLRTLIRKANVRGAAVRPQNHTRGREGTAGRADVLMDAQGWPRFARRSTAPNNANSCALGVGALGLVANDANVGTLFLASLCGGTASNSDARWGRTPTR